MARACVLRYLEDVRRDEPINVGVLLQAAGKLYFRRLENVPARRFWRARAASHCRALLDLFQAEIEAHSKQQPSLEKWSWEALRERWNSQLTLGPVSELGAIRDERAEQVLDQDFALLVGPPHRPQAMTVESALVPNRLGPRLASKVARALADWHVLPEMEAHVPVLGKKWTVDFAYRSVAGQRVYLAALDLRSGDPIAKSLALAGEWNVLGKREWPSTKVTVYAVNGKEGTSEAAEVARQVSDRAIDVTRTLAPLQSLVLHDEALRIASDHLI